MPGCRQMQRFLTELALLLEELKLDGFGTWQRRLLQFYSSTHHRAEQELEHL
jgi:hypothetical protein